MGKSLPIYMGEVPEYEVRGDHMHIIWRELELVLPVSIMLAGMASAKRAIDEWQRGGSAPILNFRREFPGD